MRLLNVPESTYVPYVNWLDTVGLVSLKEVAGAKSSRDVIREAYPNEQMTLKSWFCNESGRE